MGKKDAAILEESLDISLEEMERITKLVEELLLLTKDNTNSTASEQENVEINQEIASRIKSLEQLHYDYTFEFNAYPKALNINIDRYQLEQVLIIFIDNAMKYDQINKHIEIQTNLRNKQISIEITDHGVGIPKEDIEFIFDRFYRVDKSRSRKLGGNGLGLSIAKKIIELNNGTIHVESELESTQRLKLHFNAYFQKLYPTLLYKRLKKQSYFKLGSAFFLYLGYWHFNLKIFNDIIDL